MRAAKDILLNCMIPVDDHFGKNLIEIINEARIEAIRECAKVAVCIPITYSKEVQEYGCPSKVYCPVDKKSILKLIDEIK